MKYIVLLMLMSLALSVSAQCPLNGTNTNPNNPAPANSGFKTNTFDWRSVHFPVNKSDYTNFQPLGPFPLQSPFYSTDDYLSGIAAGPESDFQPSDGWELIKQDFGYLYSGGTWNGTAMGLNGNTQYNKSIAYFLLYNKYSAKLRLFATVPKQGQVSADKISVKLKFIGSNQNALFNHYQSVALPLDQKTNVREVQSIALFPSSKQNFFYADFQLAYDPCTCFFENGIEASFYTISSAKAYLSGKLVGVNAQMADITNGSGAMYGDSGIEDYLMSSYTDGANNVEGANQVFKSINELLAEMGASNPSLSEGLQSLTGFLASGTTLAIAANPEAAAGLELFAGLLDFFSGQMESGGGEVSPTVIVGDIGLGGKIVTQILESGYDFKLALPGSLNSGNRPEYANASANVQPNYSMYNEVTGLFSLNKTPKIKRKDYGYVIGGSTLDYDQVRCPFPNPPNMNVFVYYTNQHNGFSYQIDKNSIQYSLNPLVNANNTRIEASIELEAEPNSSSTTSFPNFECRNLRLHSNGVEYSEDMATGRLTARNSIFKRYRTRFFSLDCINNVIPYFKYDFRGCRRDLFEYKSQKAFLVLNIYYEFNPDANGVRHTSFQTIKYPIDIEETTNDLRNNVNYTSLSAIPTDASISTPLVLQSLPFVAVPNSPFKSFGKISISASVTNLAGVDGEIIAEESIELLPGAEILYGGSIGSSGSVALYIEDPTPSIICGTSSQIVPSIATSQWCNSSNYKANQTKYQETLLNENGQESLAKTVFEFTAAPNPFNEGGVRIDFGLEQAGRCMVTVHDALGKQVAVLLSTDTAAEGPQQLFWDAAGAPVGIYFVTLHTEQGRQSIKVSKQ